MQLPIVPGNLRVLHHILFQSFGLFKQSLFLRARNHNFINSSQQRLFYVDRKIGS